MYIVGEIIGDVCFVFEQVDGVCLFDLVVDQMFGFFLKIYMVDKIVECYYENVLYEIFKLNEYICCVFQLEVVVCKDWLINKVDCFVIGKIVC